MNIVEIFILFIVLLLGLPVLVVVGIYAFAQIEFKFKRRLFEFAKNSEKIKQLTELTEDYKRVSLLSKDDYRLLNRTISAQVNTIGGLDKYDYEWDLWNEVRENKDDYYNLISVFSTAKQKNDEYQRKYYGILYTKKKYFKSEFKNKLVYDYELTIGNKIKVQELPRSITLKIVINYSSPKGRNTDTREKIIHENEIKYYCTHEINRKKYIYQEDAQVERGKMNESLRYDVFQRDGFKCCICGASAKDGAKLQVDHIIPVSKGGKTVMSNLQTLCDRCNRGKSNKL